MGIVLAFTKITRISFLLLKHVYRIIKGTVMEEQKERDRRERGVVEKSDIIVNYNYGET
jgi:hypothetical protein